MSGLSIPLLWRYPKVPGIRTFGPLKSHFIANISKTVSRSVTCQWGLINISSMGDFEKRMTWWHGAVAPMGVHYKEICCILRIILSIVKCEDLWLFNREDRGILQSSSSSSSVVPPPPKKKMRLVWSWISCTVGSLLRRSLASDILIELAIKSIHNLPPRLSCVSTLPDITQ